MNFGTAIATGFQKYSDFTGKASRSEFWWFQLFLVLVFLGTSTVWPPLGFVWGLAVVVPYFASWVRRLRDAGFPWGLIFLAPIPVIGTVVLIVLWTQPTKVEAGE